MSNENLPSRVVVGKNGAFWRDYTDQEPSFYSMCPVSDDNDPVEVIAVYVRADEDLVKLLDAFAAHVRAALAQPAEPSTVYDEMDLRDIKR
jgi:hypothetical protein